MPRALRMPALNRGRLSFGADRRAAAFAVFIGSILGACVPASQAYLTRTRIGEVVNDPGYTPGREIDAAVGDVMVRSRSYSTRRTQTGYIQSTEPFQIRVGGIEIKGAPEERHTLRALADIDGIPHYVMTLHPGPGSRGVVFYVNPDGLLHTRARMQYAHLMMLVAVRTDPPSVRFLPEDSVEVVPDSGGHNFDLIYAGAAQGVIHLGYHELGSDNAIVLNYDADARDILIRDIRIHVISLSGDRIVFRAEAAR